MFLQYYRFLDLTYHSRSPITFFFKVSIFFSRLYAITGVTINGCVAMLHAKLKHLVEGVRIVDWS